MTVFDRYQPNIEQQKLMNLARSDAEQLLYRAESLPESRYKSLFVTSLESTMMWFNKAVSRNAPAEPPLFDPNNKEPFHDDNPNSDPFSDQRS